MDPDAFRRTLNTTIQELRNVSFLVQKQKAVLADFDVWYPQWQNEVRSDPVMRWIVESRNLIVKQGDLDLLSKMTMRYHLNWLVAHESEVNFPPRTPLPVAARLLTEEFGLPPMGLVTVRRRWTDYRLSSRELLDALASAYKWCVLLLHRAHLAVGITECQVSLAISDCEDGSEFPECMVNLATYTEVSLNLADMEPIGLRNHIVSRDEEMERQAIERYGKPERYAALLKDARDAIGAVDAFILAGQQILAVEDDLAVLAVYFADGKPISMEGGKSQDHYGKVLWADSVAATALKLGATGVLISADSWYARVTHTALDQLPLAERSDRRDALSVVAVTKDGRLLSKSLPYERKDDGSAIFGQVNSGPAGHLRYLDPLRKAWGLESWTDVEI